MIEFRHSRFGSCETRRWVRKKGAKLVISFRFALRAVAAVVFTGGVVDRAPAQGTLQARYTASLAGIPVGTGSSFIRVGDDQYVIGANGSTSGIVRLFADGKGLGGTSGTVAGGRFVAATYEMNITNGDRADQVSVAFASGTVKQVNPPPVPSPDRVPLTDAHYKGVTDPFTASLVRVPGTGDPVSPKACQGTTAVFNGHIRFEVQLAFKRMESVRADKGYQGPAVVCALYFTPIAGYAPGRASIKYLAQRKDMEIWLAPISNTRVLAPFHVSIPTPFGLGVLHATEFVSVATPGRSTAANAKTP
jgi:hypothetical protein